MPRYRKKPNTGPHYMRVKDTDGRNKKGKGCLRPVGPNEVITCSPEELGGALNKFDRLDSEEDVMVEEMGRVEVDENLVAVNHGGGRYRIYRKDDGSEYSGSILKKDDALGLTGGQTMTAKEWKLHLDSLSVVEEEDE